MNKSLTNRNSFSVTGLALLLALALLAPAPAQGADQPLEARLEGIVSVAIADYFAPDKDGKMTGHAETRYTVRVSEFEFVDLDGDPEVLAKLKTGERVVLLGQRETPGRFLATGIVSREAGPHMTAEKAFLGEQDLAVVPVQFPNAPFPTACQWSVIDNISFSGPQALAAYWEEMSYGQLFFSDISKTFDEVTLDEDWDGLTCNLDLWTARADVKLGSEIDAYNRRVYVFPSSLGSVCPFGLGQVGNEGLGLTKSWITGCNSPDAYIHEVGHNLSLRHAWTSIEYGDTGDIMGFGGVGVRKLNGPHVDALDWLPDGEPYFKTLSGIGVYNETLTALGRDYLAEPNPTQALKIFAPSLGKVLYVTYRDNHGMDSSLGSQYQYKTHVHTQRQGTESTLLDVLSTNEAYIVGPDGITVSQITTDPAAGTVSVRVVIETPNDCEEFAPIVSIASQDRTYSAPGGTINYTLDITNEDGITCLPLDMRISAALPGLEWTANQPLEVIAAPGETAAPVFSVTSPPDVIGFTFNFSIITTVPADVQNEHTVIIPAQYRIDRILPTDPTELMMNAATPDSVSMSWQPSTDTPSGLGYYEIMRSFGDENFSMIGQSTTTDYVDTAADGGDYLWYLLRAVDNAGNVSERVEAQD